MLGIYGNVADGLGLVARDTMALGPDLGKRAAAAFINDDGDARGPPKRDRRGR